jgi:hypothetical protein
MQHGTDGHSAARNASTMVASQPGLTLANASRMQAGCTPIFDTAPLLLMRFADPPK